MSPDDPLFDPSQPSDDELEAWARALAPFRREAGELPPLGEQLAPDADPGALTGPLGGDALTAEAEAGSEGDPDAPWTAAASPPDRPRPLWLPWAIAAGLALFVGRLLWSDPAELAVLQGRAVVDGRRAGPGEALRPGDRLTVGDAGPLRLAVGSLGTVTLDPGARLDVLAAPRGGHRLGLGAGRLRAFILAPPEVFQLATPAGLAVDLGCEYTAEVGGDEVTRLSVERGMVRFEGAGRTVWVPAGAHITARPGGRPSTPLWSDATADQVDRMAKLDGLARSVLLGAGDVPDDALAAAFVKDLDGDTLALWHLLDHPWKALRRRAGLALAALVPPVEGVPADDPSRADERARRGWFARVSFDW